jgi:hypothetical protein
MAPRKNNATKAAPAKAPSAKAIKSLNEMLMKRGYDADDLDIDVVVSIDGTNYVVHEGKDGKKFFMEEDNSQVELEKEVYDELPKETKEAEEKDSEDEVVIEDEDTDKSEAEEVVIENPLFEQDKAEEVVKEVKPKEDKPKKPRAKKDDGVEGAVKKQRKTNKKSADEAETSGSSDEDATKKGKGKKRDSSKPKRHREKTCHNVFISEQMFRLQKTMPELTGRQRFTEANKLWSGMSVDEKAKLKAEFVANKAIPVA